MNGKRCNHLHIVFSLFISWSITPKRSTFYQSKLNKSLIRLFGIIWYGFLSMSYILFYERGIWNMFYQSITHKTCIFQIKLSKRRRVLRNLKVIQSHNNTKLRQTSIISTEKYFATLFKQETIFSPNFHLFTWRNKLN